MARSGCERNFKLHCLGLASLDRTIARLRSRVLHLRDGDANTSFFHQNSRYRKKNFISKLKVGDQVVTNQGDKHEAVLNYYENLLGSSQVRDFSLDLSVFHFQQHDLVSLEEPFSEDEVWATIKDLPLDKAPGPDGFTGRFISRVGKLSKWTCCWLSRLFIMVMCPNSDFSTLLSSPFCRRREMPSRWKTSGP